MIRMILFTYDLLPNNFYIFFFLMNSVVYVVRLFLSVIMYVRVPFRGYPYPPPQHPPTTTRFVLAGIPLTWHSLLPTRASQQLTVTSGHKTLAAIVTCLSVWEGLGVARRNSEKCFNQTIKCRLGWRRTVTLRPVADDTNEQDRPNINTSSAWAWRRP